MKPGDLVKRRELRGNSSSVGVVLGLIEKKCWRTHELGTMIKWDQIDPEPHAVVVFNSDEFSIPVIELEIVSSTVDDTIPLSIFVRQHTEKLNESR